MAGKVLKLDLRTKLKKLGVIGDIFDEDIPPLSVFFAEILEQY